MFGFGTFGQLTFAQSLTQQQALEAVLDATEGQDTAAVAVALVLDVALGATEAQDTVSFSVALVQNLVLDATEAQDTASFTVELAEAPVVTPEFDGDGIDYKALERNREDRDHKERHGREDLNRVIAKAFRQVTGEPEPVEPVPAPVAKKVARAVITQIRLEGLDDIQTSMANALRLVREYETAAAIDRQRQNDNDALALLLLAA